MVFRIVRLGTPRAQGDGVRIGTLRLRTRGVPKSDYPARYWYDIWFPILAPSLETMKRAQQASTPAQWKAFEKRYRAEMAKPDAHHAMELLAALSHRTNFSVGCYCEDETRCHRSILRDLLRSNGAEIG